MTTLIDDPVSESTSTSTTSLILHPGPRPKAHKAAAHLKSTKARLGSQGLLVPAEGGVPPEVDLIVDVDLSGLPVHPVGHPQYERALEFRMKVEVTYDSLAYMEAPPSTTDVRTAPLPHLTAFSCVLV